MAVTMRARMEMRTGDDTSVLALFRLRGKRAVVTGGAQGIGFEIAKAFHEAGAEIVIADINEDLGERAATQLQGHFRKMDVTRPESVREVVVGLGDIDILVNNAGIVRNTPAERTTDEEWRAVLEVNLDGVYWCCREFGSRMLARHKGCIINLASMSGFISNRPQPQASYNASKAAVIHLTRSLAGEWAARGVRVNAVAPGYVGTELTQKGLSNEAWRSAWLAAIPMGRVAEPREVAPAAVYLASDAASYVTGSVLVVDGGYTVW